MCKLLVKSGAPQGYDILHAACKSIAPESYTDYVPAHTVPLHRLDFCSDHTPSQTTHLRPHSFQFIYVDCRDCYRYVNISRLFMSMYC